MMKLVEEISGRGKITRDGHSKNVRYHIIRFQGMMENSGLPIPGLFRIEGSIDFDEMEGSRDWVNVPLILALEDGRSLAINLMDTTGRILREGHGPMKCQCC